jgi:four helix bundle protein
MELEQVVRRNKNRGYQQLRVWNDAVEYYGRTCKVFRVFPWGLKRVVSQAIACADSVHRNIAEGYCRRSIKEYLSFLYIALGSLGESVSGLHAYRQAGQLSVEDYELLDDFAYRLEYGLLNLIEALEKKRNSGEWIDQVMVKGSNAEYEVWDYEDVDT